MLRKNWGVGAPLVVMWLGCLESVNSQIVNEIKFVDQIAGTDPSFLCEGKTWGSVMSDELIIQKYNSMLVELKGKGRQPAIRIEQIEMYRQLPLRDCYTSKTGSFQFRINFPTNPIGKYYEIFNVSPTGRSFTMDDGVVCYFEYPTRGLLTTTPAGTHIVPFTPEIWKSCEGNGGCQVPAFDDVDYADTVCLQAVFSGKKGKQLVPYCKFNCMTASEHVAYLKKELAESSWLSWILK